MEETKAIRPHFPFFEPECKVCLRLHKEEKCGGSESCGFCWYSEVELKGAYERAGLL